MLDKKECLLYVLEFLKKQTEAQDGFEHEEINFAFETIKIDSISTTNELESLLTRLRDRIKVIDGPERRNIFTKFTIDNDIISIFDITTDRINLGINKINDFKPSEQSQKLQKPIIELPLGTSWHNIKIRWINGNDIEITLNNDINFKHVWDYKELGFYNERSKGPNISWQILTTAANFGGKFSWANLGGVTQIDQIKKVDAFQKRVSEIRKQLKIIFGIGEDPFETYGDEKIYRIKLILIPENASADPASDDWRDLMLKEELDKYDEISRKHLVKHPNGEDDSEIDAPY